MDIFDDYLSRADIERERDYRERKRLEKERLEEERRAAILEAEKKAKEEAQLSDDDFEDYYMTEEEIRAEEEEKKQVEKGCFEKNMKETEIIDCSDALNKIDPHKEWIDRLTYCCSRVSKNCTIKDEIRETLEDIVQPSWVEDILDARWSRESSGNYYPLNFPLDYAHIIGTNVVADEDYTLHVHAFGLGGDEIRIEFPTNEEEEEINQFLSDNGDFSRYDLCDAEFSNDPNMGYKELKELFHKVDSIRDKIIFREFDDIVNAFTLGENVRYLDLLLSIPIEGEHTVSQYIEYILKSFLKKYPHIKLRLALNFWDGAHTIGTSCSVLWKYIGFEIW